MVAVTDAILNNPNDPRAKMMQQFLGTLGGVPSPHDVDAMRKDILSGAELSQPESNYSGIDVDSSDDQEPPVDAARWLTDNFDSLIPGFIEAAKYAYSRLEEESLSETEGSQQFPVMADISVFWHQECDVPCFERTNFALRRTSSPVSA